MDLRLRYYPDPILFERCDEITSLNFPPDFQARLDFMRRIMKQKIGAGIAAPQVGWDAQVFIVAGDILGGEDRIFLNPKLRIPEEDNSKITKIEGCLSIPQLTGCVPRWNRVILITENPTTQEQSEEEFVGLAARVIQHEYDHLDGVLFIDRLSEQELSALDRRLRKMRRKYERGSK